MIKEPPEVDIESTLEDDVKDAHAGLIDLTAAAMETRVDAALAGRTIGDDCGIEELHRAFYETVWRIVQARGVKA